MSRHDVDIPIYALTASVATARRLALLPQRAPAALPDARGPRRLARAAEKLLLERGVVRRGDLIVLTVGEPMGQAGGTNTLKIVRVGEHA